MQPITFIPIRKEVTVETCKNLITITDKNGRMSPLHIPIKDLEDVLYNNGKPRSKAILGGYEFNHNSDGLFFISK